MGREMRQRLVDAAREELLEKGWDDTTGEGTRKRAGATQGSWAHFFPGAKREVAAEIFGQLRAELWVPWVRSLQAIGSRATIERSFTALLASVRADRGRWRTLFELEDALSWRSDPAWVARVQEWEARDREHLISAWAPSLMTEAATERANEADAFSHLALAPIREAARRWLMNLDAEPTTALMVIMAAEATASRIVALKAGGAGSRATRKNGLSAGSGRLDL